MSFWARDSEAGLTRGDGGPGCQFLIIRQGVCAPDWERHCRFRITRAKRDCKLNCEVKTTCRVLSAELRASDLSQDQPEARSRSAHCSWQVVFPSQFSVQL